MPVFIPAMVEYKALPKNTIVSKNQIRDILKRADINGDGCLNKEELKKAFKELGSKVPWLRAGRILKKADANHDGVLTKEELDIVVDYALAKYKLSK